MTSSPERSPSLPPTQSIAKMESLPEIQAVTFEQALDIQKTLEEQPNHIKNCNFEFTKRTGSKYAGYVVRPEEPFNEIILGLFEVSGALSSTGNWQPGYDEKEAAHPLLQANNVSEQSPSKASTVLSIRAIGGTDDPENGIGIQSLQQIQKLDERLVETIVEDARRVREKDDTPIANFPKGLSKIFEEETDVHEYEKYHPRIKGERLSIILKKPNSFDWGKYKKPNDEYVQDFVMPETPKGNISTYYEGLKNSERKPGSKTPFVATVTEDGKKKRRSLKVIDYKSKDKTEIETNDRILRSIGTGGGHLAIVTLPNDDRNRIEANLDTAFVNLKIPFPSSIDIVARLESMSNGTASIGNAPSYMDKINNIVGGDAQKRKRDVSDDEGRE